MEANGLEGTQEKHFKMQVYVGYLNLTTSGWCVMKAKAPMELHN